MYWWPSACTHRWKSMSVADGTSSERPPTAIRRAPRHRWLRSKLNEPSACRSHSRCMTFHWTSTQSPSWSRRKWWPVP